MGTLKQQLTGDLTAAMKQRDEFARSTLRMAIAAIKTAEVSPGRTSPELSDAEEVALLTKEVNQRRDSAQTYADAGRSELAAKETAEAELLGRYLPRAMSEIELDALVADAVATAEAELGARPGMKQMGGIVRAVGEQAAGRADGRTIAAKVKAALA